MLEQNLKIDGKDYTIRSADWDGEILKEAAAQLEEGILYYKKTKDELSAVVLAALAFAYDSVSKSKELPANNSQHEEEIGKILQKISVHFQSPQDEN
jgi:cell division protein ZapA (FtsZ GTPase activity inhibitor)